MHTALRSASTPTVREQVAGTAQDNRLAPPSRLLPRGERACPQVLEPANMVHLERARCRAARLSPWRQRTGLSPEHSAAGRRGSQEGILMAERGALGRLAVGGLQEVPADHTQATMVSRCTMATLVRTRFSVSSMSLSRCSPRLKHSASVVSPPSSNTSRSCLSRSRQSQP